MASIGELHDLPQAFTYAHARALGLTDRDLAQLCDREELERLARGIYNLPGLAADPDLIELALRHDKATLCLTSALAHHDLTDEIPRIIDVALPRGQRHPATAAPATWHSFDPETFDIGRDSLQLTGAIVIGIYSPARSIIDAYRLRNRFGIDAANSALKRWLKQPGNQPAELLQLARRFPRALPIINFTLQTLL